MVAGQQGKKRQRGNSLIDHQVTRSSRLVSRNKIKSNLTAGRVKTGFRKMVASVARVQVYHVHMWNIGMLNCALKHAHNTNEGRNKHLVTYLLNKCNSEYICDRTGGQA